MKLDYPDPDVIRVEDTYYMVSTTMYFMPGCEILRSFDLVNWEHFTYVYDTLDQTSAQKLEGQSNIYGKGMWAASLRFHQEMFYLCFVANDTQKTYLYRAKEIKGPWKKSFIEGFYHDPSLLFDGDHAYLVYGNTNIHLLQLNKELTGPMEGGLNRIIVSEEQVSFLGYEGSHLYKINGYYYLFLIHSLSERWRRVEACFYADSLEGEFVGSDVLNDDLGYCDQGVAQGGIVETKDGNWYGILFQDRGAVGRIPVLIPVSWKNHVPVFGEAGKIPEHFSIKSTRPDYTYRPLIQSDDFKGSAEESGIEEYGCFGFKSVWQFNHEPQLSLVQCDRTKGTVQITTGKLCENLTQAANMLTQRMLYPGCIGEVTVNTEGLKDGDYAGICTLQSCFGLVAVTKQDGKQYLSMQHRYSGDASVMVLREELSETKEEEVVLVEGNEFRLRVKVDFTEQKDEAEFFYWQDGMWKKIGCTHSLFFKIDHFTGCRFGLVNYATKETGGYATFSEFRYLES